MRRKGKGRVGEEKEGRVGPQLGSLDPPVIPQPFSQSSLHLTLKETSCPNPRSTVVSFNRFVVELSLEWRTNLYHTLYFCHMCTDLR